MQDGTGPAVPVVEAAARLGLAPETLRKRLWRGQVAGEKRDAPEIAKAVARGEYPSVRAAAKAAGLVRSRWAMPADDVPAMARYLAARLTPEQRAELVRLLAGA